jgi:hypothetical protein
MIEVWRTRPILGTRLGALRQFGPKIACTGKIAAIECGLDLRGECGGIAALLLAGRADTHEMRGALHNAIDKRPVRRLILFGDLVGERAEAVGERAGCRRAGLRERLECRDLRRLGFEAFERG